MTAVLPSPRLRTFDEPRFVPAPRQTFPCPYCQALLRGPLDVCEPCLTAENDHDRALCHLEDFND